MRKLLLAAAALALASGCIRRAPTTYELDRRAGFAPPGKAAPKDVIDELHTSSAVARAPRLPVKVPPLIEKVWVSDLPLGPDARLQGTWMYLEVERGRWLDEVDPGGAPLLDLEGKRDAQPRSQGAAPKGDAQ